MPNHPRDRPNITTPEEEGLELHPDAWDRFKRNVRKVMKASPVHRTGKPTGGDQQRKRRGRTADKTSG